MIIMLAVIFCLLVIGLLLAISEFLWRQKILRGENQRKFVHITVGSFVAFWPWLVSWQTIQLIGVAMLAVCVLNWRRPIFHFMRDLPQEDYGVIFYALAVISLALLTDIKIFFALAMLHVALADGFAAVVGTIFGNHWKYQIFRQTKTVMGSMTFWFASLCILGVGTLYAHELISFGHYAVLLLVLPPIATAVESIAVRGLDNIAVPLVVLWALHVAQTMA